jgi:hypothetical protein
MTYPIVGLGMPTIAAIACANCKKEGEAWGGRGKSDLEVQWDGSDETVTADFFTPN